MKLVKSYQISSVQIPYLVRLSADLFREMNDEIKSIGASQYTPHYMHYVADLIKDYVDTAYPIENQSIQAEKEYPEDVLQNAYKETVYILKQLNVSDYLIPTFEQWKKQVKSIVIKQEGVK